MYSDDTTLARSASLSLLKSKLPVRKITPSIKTGGLPKGFCRRPMATTRRAACRALRPRRPTRRPLSRRAERSSLTSPTRPPTSLTTTSSRPPPCHVHQSGAVVVSRSRRSTTASRRRRRSPRRSAPPSSSTTPTATSAFQVRRHRRSRGLCTPTAVRRPYLRTIALARRLRTSRQRGSRHRRLHCQRSTRARAPGIKPAAVTTTTGQLSPPQNINTAADRYSPPTSGAAQTAAEFANWQPAEKRESPLAQLRRTMREAEERDAAAASLAADDLAARYGSLMTERDASSFLKSDSIFGSAIASTPQQPDPPPAPATKPTVRRTPVSREAAGAPPPPPPLPQHAAAVDLDDASTVTVATAVGPRRRAHVRSAYPRHR